MIAARDFYFGPFGPVELSVASGECVGLSGPSGSGKTLLLRALADLDPHRGELSLLQRPYTEFTGPQWRRRASYLPSESAWWDDTVGAHFEHIIDQDWHTLGFEETVAGWETERLSSGERQRLGLLRALQHRPPVLLLDEPTANLDRDNTDRVERLIADYRGRQVTAIVWVSHDPAQIQRVADRYLRISGGALLA